MSAAEDLDPGAFPALSAGELAEAAAFGSERQTAAGELLFEAGEASYDLFVVLEGEVEVVRLAGAEAVVIVAYGRGGFVGELNLLTGQRRTLSCRVCKAARVLVIAEPELRRLMSGRPALADKIFNALLASLGLGREDVPAVTTATETLRRPSPAVFAEHLGLTFQRTPGYIFDLVVVGSGPAGLAAAAAVRAVCGVAAHARVDTYPHCAPASEDFVSCGQPLQPPRAGEATRPCATAARDKARARRRAADRAAACGADAHPRRCRRPGFARRAWLRTSRRRRP